MPASNVDQIGQMPEYIKLISDFWWTPLCALALFLAKRAINGIDNSIQEVKTDVKDVKDDVDSAKAVIQLNAREFGAEVSVLKQRVDDHDEEIDEVRHDLSAKIDQNQTHMIDSLERLTDTVIGNDKSRIKEEKKNAVLLGKVLTILEERSNKQK
jgi:hypothetical protein